MLEYEDVFGNAEDAFDALQEKYEALKQQYDTLRLEYDILYNALMGHLDEARKIKDYLIDKYQKDLNDLSMTKDSIENARRRAYNE